MSYRVFLFGEAEKGEFCMPFVCTSLTQLAERFGNPPPDSLGLCYAVQALLFQRELIFFRVKEEGFSCSDYKRGVQLLSNRSLFHNLSAVCIPGVGDREIIDPLAAICLQHRSLLVTTEKDFYDFLTSRS